MPDVVFNFPVFSDDENTDMYNLLEG